MEQERDARDERAKAKSVHSLEEKAAEAGLHEVVVALRNLAVVAQNPAVHEQRQQRTGDGEEQGYVPEVKDNEVVCVLVAVRGRCVLRCEDLFHGKGNWWDGRGCPGLRCSHAEQYSG